MNDRDFLQASMPPEVIGATHEQRLFDRNMISSQPSAEILDQYRMPEGRQQSTAQSTAEASPWRARYQAAPAVAVTRYDAKPGAAALEGQAVRQIRYDQGLPQAANLIAPESAPKSYSEMKVAAKSDSIHSSKDEPSRLLVIGVEIALAAVALRYGLKYLPKSGINVLRESANLTKGAQAGAKGVEAEAQAAQKPFAPDLTGLSSVPKSLLGPDGRFLIRTGQRNDATLRVG